MPLDPRGLKQSASNKLKLLQSCASYSMAFIIISFSVLHLVNYKGPLFSDVIEIDIEVDKPTPKIDLKAKTTEKDSKPKTIKDTKVKSTAKDSTAKTAKDLTAKTTTSDKENSTKTKSPEDRCKVYVYKDEPWYEDDGLYEFLWETVEQRVGLDIDMEDKEELVFLFEPRREKTGLRVFRPGLTQTSLYSHRSRLEA